MYAIRSYYAGIVAGVFIIRLIFLKIFRFSALPLLFIAPRGLITILLFLSIPISSTISLVNQSLVTQVIIATAFIMMVGLMFNKEVQK